MIGHSEINCNTPQLGNVMPKILEFCDCKPFIKDGVNTTITTNFDGSSSVNVSCEAIQDCIGNAIADAVDGIEYDDLANKFRVDLCELLSQSVLNNSITPSVELIGKNCESYSVQSIVNLFQETSITATDSNTIDFTSSGTSNHTITGDVKISTDVGNIITSTATGIFAPTTVIPPTTVSNTVTGSGISRTISTTVNGVTGTAVNIPDTDAQTLSIVGNTVSISNGNSISLPAETVTTITNTVAGNKIADYTNESGSVVPINETITSISGNNYISENGTSNPIIQTNTLTLNGSNDLISTVNGVASTPLDLQGAIQAEETTTTLTKNTNGSITYTNEDGVAITTDLPKKCDNTDFDYSSNKIPQVDQTPTTTYSVGTTGTEQCLFRQDMQFDATNNSFEFNSVNGPSIATGSFSMSNATNQALGARALALGGTGGIVGANTTNSGALSVSGTSLTGTGTLFGALFSNAGSITGTSNRKTLLGTSNCSIQGTGSDNHIAYSSLVTMNTTGSLNTTIGCFTGTWLNGAKESGMWGAQAGNINTTNARVNIWGGDNNQMTGNARNAGAHDGEGLISNTVDQMVHGSYNIAANNTTLSNSGSVANYTRVHGNGNAVTRHVASAESSRGEYFLQSNGAPGDAYTTAINTGVVMTQPFTGQLMSKLFVNYNSVTSQYELWFGTPNGNLLIASI